MRTREPSCSRSLATAGGAGPVFAPRSKFMSATGSRRQRSRTQLHVAAAALVSVALWASAFVGIRAAGSEFGPGQLAAGRLLIGCVVLGILVALRRAPLPSRRELPLIVLCGLLWFALYNVALNAGEQRVDAGTASMIIRIGPVLIALLAGLVLKEGFSRHVFAGGAIALGGTAVIALATADTGASSIDGTLLCVIAAAAYAGGVVTEKVVLRSVSALHTVFLCCAVGALACSPFVPSLVEEVATASGGSIAWLAYLGVFPTAVAFTTWAYALARSAAAPLGALANLGPPISILLAWSMLHETPQPIALAGGATCLAGVAVSRRPRAPHARPNVH
jgi:drug/metabolite transporter (DMT)-like permease